MYTPREGQLCEAEMGPASSGVAWKTLGNTLVNAHPSALEDRVRNGAWVQGPPLRPTRVLSTLRGVARC